MIFKPASSTDFIAEGMAPSIKTIVFKDGRFLTYSISNGILSAVAKIREVSVAPI
jgi:hypothetical protein